MPLMHVDGYVDVLPSSKAILICKHLVQENHPVPPCFFNQTSCRRFHPILATPGSAPAF